MARKIKKVGKIPMARSEKEKLDKVEVEEVIDQETKDFTMYLGGDLKTLAEKAEAE
jgi:hypothetical protein